MRAPFDRANVLAKLTLEEKIRLTAGSDIWRTAAIERLGVPYIKTTDGPNGARGGGDFNDATPSTLFPSPSCLGATWDVAAAYEMGRFIGLDAIEKQCHVVLGPTINIQRDPRAGRFFESYSEDAALTGHVASAWVRGAQSTGVAATMKHFVGNEAETDRKHSSSDVDAVALREVYLEPFRLIMTGCARAGDAGFGNQPACVMTSYNRINGVSGSENELTICKILRGEWGFAGLVMSDWFALHAAGLRTTDLEMPGPTIFRRVDEVVARTASEPDLASSIDACAERVLKLVCDVAPLGYRKSVAEEKESSVDVNVVGPAIRRIAAEGAVLLKNDGNLLPLTAKRGLRIACIGTPWVDAIQSGGGSAALTPQKVMQPLSTLEAALRKAGHDVKVDHYRGCAIHNFVTMLDVPMSCKFYTGRTPGSGRPVGKITVEQATLKPATQRPENTPANDYWIRGSLDVAAPTSDVTYRFGFVCMGSLKARVYAYGKDETVAEWTFQGDPDLFEYMLNPKRVWSPFYLPVRAGQKLRLEVDYVPTVLHEEYKDTLMSGMQVAMEYAVDEDAQINEAARAASEADVAVVLTALGKDWESEGYDRADMHLPRLQDKLVAAVGRAAPGKTAVLNITGGAIAMPWRDAVTSIVQCWYGGQEGAEALVDVLLARGDAPASGRLAHSWPAAIEDHPSGTDPAHFPGLAGEGGPHVNYVEGRLVGYKYYNKNADKVQPLYSFGFGLGGYTTFQTEGPKVATTKADKSSLPLKITIKTTNVGDRSGREVAQVYVRLTGKSGADEPVQKLAGFATLRPGPGNSAEETIELHQDAFSVWNEAASCWQIHAGAYEVILARSARLGDELGRAAVQVDKGWSWTGLGL